MRSISGIESECCSARHQRRNAITEEFATPSATQAAGGVIGEKRHQVRTGGQHCCVDLFVLGDLGYPRRYQRDRWPKAPVEVVATGG
jgi:hypothetical protein